MSKFAPVAPARIYEAFAEHRYVPEQILLLAHDVVQHEKAYEGLFDDPIWENTNIIMDNSVVELGEAADANMVLEAASIVGADVVVLPDILGKGEESTRATVAAWPHWYWEFRDYQKMILIQGNSLKDWLHSAECMMHLEPDWVGIPRIAEDTFCNREVLHRFQLVDFAHSLFPEAQIHLFGFSNHIHWDLYSASHPWVTSIDSAVPLRLSSNFIFTEPQGKRGDWWETAKFTQQMITNCQLVDAYIERMTDQ
jgi:hypothetical protein